MVNFVLNYLALHLSLSSLQKASMHHHKVHPDSSCKKMNIRQKGLIQQFKDALMQINEHCSVAMELYGV